jgi:membrane protease subunit HflK
MAGPPPLSSIRFPKPRLGVFLWLALIIPLAILLLTGIFSCFYTVSPESVAVVQRFGKFQSVQPPGLHFKIPFGVDTATVVPIRRQLKLEFGFNSPGATSRDQHSEDPGLERDMVTGDLNAAQVEWIVQYGISAPEKYLFHVRDPGPTLRDLTESVMREVVGDRTVDEVLTIGRSEIETEALVKLQKLAEHIDMGLRVEQIQLKNVNPPGPVQHSFEDVNRAQQEREQMINEANGQYNQVIPKARGLAQQRISGAEGYAVRRINEAQGDVARFQQLLLQYDKAPAVTKQRLYLETMTEVLPKLGSKVILDEDAKQFLPLMNLNQGTAPAR